MDMTEIKSVVMDSFVKQALAFTSGHITAALRTSGYETGQLSHFRVSEEVRRLWAVENFPGYTRTLLQIGGHLIFAYHPRGVTPTEMEINPWPKRLQPSDVNPITDVDTVVTVDTVDADNALDNAKGYPKASDLYAGGKTPATGDTFSLEYNGEGYAQIPRQVTRFLGWQPGDEVLLGGVLLGKSATLRKAETGETPVARLQPTNGQLRLRDAALMKFGVGMASTLNIKVEADHLILT